MTKEDHLAKTLSYEAGLEREQGILAHGKQGFCQIRKHLISSAKGKGIKNEYACSYPSAKGKFWVVS